MHCGVLNGREGQKGGDMCIYMANSFLLCSTRTDASNCGTGQQIYMANSFLLGSTRTDASNCGTGEDSWESLGQQGDQTSLS